MEQCKKEDTWKNLKDLRYSYSPKFLDDLLNKTLLDEQMKSEAKENKSIAKLDIESEIVRLGGPYWRHLIQEGLNRKLLSPMEIDLLNIAASIDTPRPKIASPKQAQLIWKIRKKT